MRQSVQLGSQSRILGGGPNQVFIEDELVAVVDQQIGGGLLDPHPDDVAAVFPQLRDQWRKVAVSGNQDEGIDVVPLIGKVQGIHHHSDVGAVLAAVTALRYVDQLDGGLVKGSLEFGIAMPVGVGPLDGDLSLLDQPLEDEVNVEIAVSALADTHGHVLKVDKDGNSSFVDLHVCCPLV